MWKRDDGVCTTTNIEKGQHLYNIQGDPKKRTEEKVK